MKTIKAIENKILLANSRNRVYSSSFSKDGCDICDCDCDCDRDGTRDCGCNSSVREDFFDFRLRLIRTIKRMIPTTTRSAASPITIPINAEIKSEYQSIAIKQQTRCF
jgi:hypothetical protein